MFLYGAKGKLHLLNDQYLLMRKSLEKAIKIGEKKFREDNQDYFNIRLDMALYNVWMHNIDEALSIYILNEQIAEKYKSLALKSRIVNLEWIIECALEVDDLNLFDRYYSILDTISRNTEFEKDIAITKNKKLFDYFLSKNQISKAQEYFEKLNFKEDTLQEYEFELSNIDYFIKTNQIKKAKSKVQILENAYNSENMPLHHFFWINLKLKKLRVAIMENDKNEQISLVTQISNSLDNNFKNLFNSNANDQVLKIKNITNRYLKLLELMLNNSDIQIITSIYNNLNKIKNASATFFILRNDFINKSKDEKLKSDFKKLKILTSVINENNFDETTARLKNDTIIALNKSIEDRLDSSKIVWHNDYNLIEIMKNIEEDELFLDYYMLTDKRLVVFILSHDRFDFRIIGDNNLISNAINSETNYVNNKNKNIELYKLILDPINDHLEGKSKIYISTEELTEKIAFEILSRTGSKNDMLAHDFQVIYVENAAGLVNEHRIAKLQKQQINIALFGGIRYNCYPNQTNSKIETQYSYLPGSEREVISIDSICESRSLKSVLLKECNATVDTLIYYIENQNINHLHISTHGINKYEKDTDNIKFEKLIKDNSKLLFSDNKNSSTYLTADELLMMNLTDKDLVFLSACSTGTGNYFPSFGNVSIANAFKKAGARYVVATLWNIPDDITQEFCIQFYLFYIDNKDVDISMKMTKEIFSKKYSPKNWAAFRVLH